MSSSDVHHTATATLVRIHFTSTLLRTVEYMSEVMMRLHRHRFVVCDDTISKSNT